MNGKGVFITGTDTEVGKTYVAAAVVSALTGRGLRVCGYKPVAAGCEQTADGWRNEDALQLQAAGNSKASYAQLNPVALPPAIAPHIAAEELAVSLSVSHLLQAQQYLQAQHDWVVTEGAGGWTVPLNDQERLSDLAIAMRQPVILVVGMRLGCINHALLTAEAIGASGLPLIGWVANHLSANMPRAAENRQAIAERLTAPLLAELPYASEQNYLQSANSAAIQGLVSELLATVER